MAESIEDIAKLLENVRFRKKRLGGVDEEDVWKTIEVLQKAFEEVLHAEQLRCEGVLGEWKKYARHLEGQLQQRGGGNG